MIYWFFRMVGLHHCTFRVKNLGRKCVKKTATKQGITLTTDFYEGPSYVLECKACGRIKDTGRSV